MKVFNREPRPNHGGIVQHLPVWRTCLSAKVLAGYWLSWRCLDGRLHSVGQRRVDFSERSADSSAQSIHGSHSAKSDDSNHQSVVKQILTFVAAHQILEVHILLETHGIHFESSH